MLSRLFFIASVVVSMAVEADELGGSVGINQDCQEGPMAQFGQYVGDWKIEDEQLAQDGSAWSEGKGARWIFACVGEGTAIQDFWIPNGGGFGTNLRTYNPETKTWEIVWAASSQKGLMHITAKQDESGVIVMDIVKPKQTPPRRIKFFPATETGWNWVSEMSFDEEKTWIPVYKIKATPYSMESSND